MNKKNWVIFSLKWKITLGFFLAFFRISKRTIHHTDHIFYFNDKNQQQWCLTHIYIFDTGDQLVACHTPPKQQQQQLQQQNGKTTIVLPWVNIQQTALTSCLISAKNQQNDCLHDVLDCLAHAKLNFALIKAFASKIYLILSISI